MKLRSMYRTFWNATNRPPLSQSEGNGEQRSAAKEIEKLREKAERMRGKKDIATRLNEANAAASGAMIWQWLHSSACDARGSRPRLLAPPRRRRRTPKERLQSERRRRPSGVQRRRHKRGLQRRRQVGVLCKRDRSFWRDLVWLRLRRNMMHPNAWGSMLFEWFLVNAMTKYRRYRLVKLCAVSQSGSW